jgi:hypothetical protein
VDVVAANPSDNDWPPRHQSIFCVVLTFMEHG